MKFLISIFSVLFSLSAFSKYNVDKIVVYKNERKMQMHYKGKVVKEYKIALSILHNSPGFTPGPKRLRGDNKTPEGNYKIIKKRKNTRFPLSLLINYPSKKDIDWGKKNGYSKSELGDYILIHGYPTSPNPAVLKFAKALGMSKDGLDGWLRNYFYPYFDWTNGCVAVSDKEMKEIFESVKKGTPIEIYAYEDEYRARVPYHLEGFPLSYQNKNI